MSLPFASRRQRRRRPPVARTLFVLVACTFMLVSAATTGPATARQAELESSTEVPLDDQTVQQEPQEPAPADIPATPDAESMAAASTAPETFTLAIDKRDCNDPATAPYGSGSLADYQANCPAPMSAQFEAANDYGYFDVQVGSSVTFNPPSEFTTVSELLPAGYGAPAIFCDLGDGMAFQNDTNSSVTVIGKPGDTISCAFYNMVLPGEDDSTGTSTPDAEGYGDITIHKYECPAGYDVHSPSADPLNDCTNAMNGVPFTLDHPDPAATDLQTTTGDSIPGAVMFGSVESASYSVVESPPSGIDSAFVWNCYNNGQLVPGFAPLHEGFTFPLTVSTDDTFRCNWFNVPEEEEPAPTETPDPEPVDLYIEKHTCPAGYDASAPMADPRTDCPAGPNGINFTLADEDPATVDLMTMTGDSIDNTVTFGSLLPGTYTITEDVPAGIATVFVLDCVGAMEGMVRPVPFSTGNVLTLDITGFEGEIFCDWYNVPADPHGTLTVIKYACTTEHYVSDVDCEILETGQGFDLYWWDGSTWVAETTGITDGYGRLTFTGLDSGAWWIDEHNQAWCHIVSDDLSDDGNWIQVTASQETVIKVYNCGAERTWKTPTKYPNTGVAPVIHEPSLG